MISLVLAVVLVAGWSPAEEAQLYRYKELVDGEWGVPSEIDFECDENFQRFELDVKTSTLNLTFDQAVGSGEEASTAYWYVLRYVTESYLVLEGPSQIGVNDSVNEIWYLYIQPSQMRWRNVKWPEDDFTPAFRPCSKE